MGILERRLAKDQKYVLEPLRSMEEVRVLVKAEGPDVAVNKRDFLPDARSVPRILH
jgi:hypothetical protein